LAITVRGATRWDDDQKPPPHTNYTARDIETLAGTFETIEIELFKLRRCIEARHEHSMPGEEG
jgi:hypothetical protein